MTNFEQTPLNIGVVLFDKATLMDFAATWGVFTRLLPDTAAPLRRPAHR